MRWGDLGALSLHGYLWVVTRTVDKLGCSTVLGPTQSCLQRGCSRNWTQCWAPLKPSATRTTSYCPTPAPSSTRCSTSAVLCRRRAPVCDLHSCAWPPRPKVGGPRVTSRPMQRLQKAPFTGQPARHSHPLQLLPVCWLSVNHPYIHLHLWLSRQKGYDCERIYSFRDIFKCSALFRNNPCTYFNVLLPNLFLSTFLRYIYDYAEYVILNPSCELTHYSDSSSVLVLKLPESPARLTKMYIRKKGKRVLVFTCVQLFVAPWACSPPGFSLQEYWSG